MATTARRPKAYRGMGMEGPIAHWYARNTGKMAAEFEGAARGVAETLRPGAEVLEVAPGPGYFAVELARLGDFRVVGLDVSESFVRIATEHARLAGVEVEFLRGNAS